MMLIFIATSKWSSSLANIKLIMWGNETWFQRKIKYKILMEDRQYIRNYIKLIN